MSRIAIEFLAYLSLQGVYMLFKYSNELGWMFDNE